MVKFVRESIPPATVSRLPLYLRVLGEMPKAHAMISSEQLANVAGANSAQVRKDLSYLGSYGVRGVGYDTVQLRTQIEMALGLSADLVVAIIGAGNLGSALANYKGFNDWGFSVGALFDVDAAKVGSQIDGLAVQPMSRLEDLVASAGVMIGVIATPAGAAQEVADRLVSAGVTSILNFAPTVLRVPEEVQVRRVDLSTELQILSFHLHSGRRSASAG
ncbi:MAG: redox-sensing transcriptional repressor Rex [Acidimicrobiia bacterium]|nr:redox-sensing transcriptional repressor Rex [Acidimicrobiia bacterium]